MHNLVVFESKFFVNFSGLGADFSSGSLVTIGLVGALPLAAIIIIWTFFFYCICKNEYDYRKIYKVQYHYGVIKTQ